MEVSQLTCTVCVEKIGVNGEAENQKIYKQSCLSLGRNELQDVVLKLSHNNGTLGPYTVKEHSIHKRFLKDGKAGIRLLTQKLHFLISNCPPGLLSTFLKSLAVKIAARGDKQGAKQRMFGDVSLQFDEISPLTERDFEMARQKRNDSHISGGRKPLQPITPKSTRTITSGSLKRKLDECEEENNASSSRGAVAQPPPQKKYSMVKSGPPLTSEQQHVVDLVINGHSVFFTGSAGTGKSFLLKRLVSMLPPESTFATASTGAAACLIGGTTLHQFAGMGTGGGTVDQCIALASRPHKAEQWKRCQCLIIDEISMIEADFFDKLEAVARTVRRRREPFGGLQLVLCGDFLQLPPVTKKGERKYCFQVLQRNALDGVDILFVTVELFGVETASKSWRHCVGRTVELVQVQRQADQQFIALLQSIRVGRCPPHVAEKLTATASNEIERNGIKATKLFTHREDVDQLNQQDLTSLPGKEKCFWGEDSHPSMEQNLNGLCPVPKELVLKVGAQVMLAKNISVQEGLVNGARGVITGFDASRKGLPVVRFVSGKVTVVGPERWSVRTGGGTVATRKQLPLKLAWAMSIHKSQGMTLDCVEVSLSKVFEDGQAYVALSRAKSLQGLRVLDFAPSCVRAHKDVLDFYRALRHSRKKYIENGQKP